MSSEVQSVQQIRNQIEQELVSMRLGLYGLAAGVAKHQFIEMKMHRLGTYEDELAAHVGKEEATQFSCQTYMRVLEEKEPV